MTTRHEYPRPQLRRSGWTSLNGPWQFALDPDAQLRSPDDVHWNATITIPFAPETAASGIGETGFFRACWYRRTLDAPSLAPGERLMLHFGAVDYSATVWVNGVVATRHQGGYTPFAVDITPFLVEGGPQTLVVRAEDDPRDLAKPRGKQDWLREPHSIWYPRTSGIWQTVWLERLPPTAISSLRWTANLEHWEIGLDAVLDGEERDDLTLRVRLSRGESSLADDRYAVVGTEVHRRIALSDPGIDDYRSDLLWRPTRPTLIEVTLQLLDGHDQVIDEVQSYTALRTVTVEGDRFLMNGRSYPLRMVLDQGYWCGTGATPPDDESIRRDVQLVKEMGFNGVRKHQKIEDPRYLYWADTLGLLVWEEMPSAYRFTRQSSERLMREWREALERDASHPCIVAWVPFNESWGVPDLPTRPEQRHYVQALYHLTKMLDPSRPVIGNDGWESVATDIVGVHDYEDDLAILTRRYATAHSVSELFEQERPGGRPLTLDGHPHAGQPVMLTEFGGIHFGADPERTFGYTRVDDAAHFAASYSQLLGMVNALPLFAGFCYTQFTDTYQETNGLLYADRTPKVPLEVIARATRGRRRYPGEADEHGWAERRPSARPVEQRRAEYVPARRSSHRFPGALASG